MRPGATLFVYGTLRDGTRVRRLVGRPLPSRPAVLRGYYRTIDLALGYPVVRRRAGASVVGRLLLDVDARARAALDAYEGTGYRLAGARVRTRDGELVRTRMYVAARPGRPGRRAPQASADRG